MYIFELIVNAFKSKKYNRFEYTESDSGKNSPDTDECDHCFLPLDSTNTLFACKFCGLVVPREKLKDKNIFRKSPR